LEDGIIKRGGEGEGSCLQTPPGGDLIGAAAEEGAAACFCKNSVAQPGGGKTGRIVLRGEKKKKVNAQLIEKREKKKKKGERPVQLGAARLQRKNREKKWGESPRGERGETNPSKYTFCDEGEEGKKKKSERKYGERKDPEGGAPY